MTINNNQLDTDDENPLNDNLEKKQSKEEVEEEEESHEDEPSE